MAFSTVIKGDVSPMIYVNEIIEQTELFERLLESTKNTVLEQLVLEKAPSSLSGSDFELIVYKNAVSNAISTPFEGKLVHTADREFPDIVANGYFGIEVKKTSKDDWTSIGNSVLESSRIDTVEKIYMFFGKLGGSPDIKYRNYEDCLKGISVTHYPRYQIDMMLSEDASIFTKMGVEYDAIRKSNNPVASVRAYYKAQMKEGDSLWWIGDDVEEMPALSPIIRNFSSLDSASRDDIKADIFAFFPEVFSSGSKKYERIPAYLASQHGVVTANLRDNFTAGGQVKVFHGQNSFMVPQIVGEALRLANKIQKSLYGKNEVQMSNYWLKHIDNFSTSSEAWLKEIDHQSIGMNLPVKLSELFKSAFSVAD